MTPKDVRDIAGVLGRVQQDPEYHAYQHGYRWEDVVFALQTCFHVTKDRRAEHVQGYVAFGHKSRFQKARIDFNLARDERGPLILVVTAFDHP